MKNLLKLLAAFSAIPALLFAIALYNGVKIAALSEAGTAYIIGVVMLTIWWLIAGAAERLFKKRK